VLFVCPDIPRYREHVASVILPEGVGPSILILMKGSYSMPFRDLGQIRLSANIRLLGPYFSASI